MVWGSGRARRGFACNLQLSENLHAETRGRDGNQVGAGPFVAKILIEPRIQNISCLILRFDRAQWVGSLLILELSRA